MICMLAVTDKLEFKVNNPGKQFFGCIFVLHVVS